MEVFFLDILYEFHEIWNQSKCNEICIKLCFINILKEIFQNVSTAKHLCWSLYLSCLDA